MAYKYPKTPELIEKLKPFWNEMREAQGRFENEIAAIESRMHDATGIDGIEFWTSDMDEGIVGIGTWDRSMELIHDSELDRDD